MPNQTNAMFTNVEGEWDDVMGAIRASIEKVAETAPRVSVLIKLDYWPDAAGGRLARDVESVERRLH